MSRARLTVVAVLVTCCALMADAARAQEASTGRAYAGLFKVPDAPAGVSSRKMPTGLLSVRLFESAERESREGNPVDVAQRREGARAELQFARTTRRLEYAVAGGVQFETGRTGFGVDNQWIEMGARMPVTPRFSLTASERMAYSPQCVLGTFSTSQLPADNNLLAGPGSVTAAQSNMTLGAAVTAERSLSRRTTLQAAYRHDRLAAASCGVPAVDDRISLRVGRRLTRTAQLWVGGGRLRGTNHGSAGAPAATTLAEVRLEYHPAAWRRTALRLTAAPGRMAARPGQSGSTAIEGGADMEYRASANTALDLGYQRQLSYPQGTTRAVPLTTWRGSGTWEVSRTIRLTGGVARSASSAGSGQDLVSTTGVARADVLVGGAPIYLEYAWHSRRGTLQPVQSTSFERMTGQGLRVGVRLDRNLFRGHRSPVS